jgi:hypothetical protein
MEEGTLPFQRVAMDFITGLLTHKGKDAIITIVDHGCFRAAIFLSCSMTITGPGINNCTWTTYIDGLIGKGSPL